MNTATDMYRFVQSVIKEFNLLLRDKVGLLLMFLMPIVLVLVITSLQNNTFKIINEHQIGLIVLNQDQGEVGSELTEVLAEAGLFSLVQDETLNSHENLIQAMESNDALVGIWLPPGFSEEMESEVERLAIMAIGQDANEVDTLQASNDIMFVYYSPVLQESYRAAIDGTLLSSMKMIRSKKMLNSVFMALNNESIPADLEEALLDTEKPFKTRVVTSDGTGKIPNASQHNIPAWTIFAMFFMVVSLGSSLVREKNNGSFIRLKTMPGAFLYHLLSKQFVYVLVSLLQVFVIFSLGVCLFPSIGLPALDIPSDVFALFLTSIITGLAAVSYALCIGVFARTEEQSNGFGAVSIVILAAMGGILVPAFAMPDTFRIFTTFSPLYWCLEAYYDLFLNNYGTGQILKSLIPLGVFILVLQGISYIGLKRKNLI